MHVHNRFHFTRDLIKENRTRVNYVPTNDMVVDVLMKSLPRVRHEHLSKDLGLL